jgi:oligopeptide/dipeptide ABC transporter ATP-binding protein
MQIVFQDPFSSLNPRLKVATNVAEPLRAAGLAQPARREKVAELLADVGLRADQGARYPHELSGGQRQRVAIARALALDPQFVVADEAVSALDVSIQAQVLNLLADLQKARGLSYLFIAHNLAAVRYISHRVAVMYLGRIVELAPATALFARPRHPYTEALIDAVPGMTGARRALPGEPPDPMNPPSGCPFRTRCRHAQPVCAAERPELREVAPGIAAACHFAADLTLDGVAGRSEDP